MALKMVDEATVIKVICDRLGCVEYEDLLETLEVDDVENVIKNGDFFTVIQQNKSKKILVTTKIRRCKTNECQERCTDLHLCKFSLLGQCNTQRCKYGHSLKTEHNSRVLREHGLQDLNKDQLRVLLLQNDSSLLPSVCVSYNKGSGNFGNCPDKEHCVRLHVCERYVRGLCDGSECKRCHDFHEPHPAETLGARGVSSHLIGSLLQIYQNILILKDYRYARDKYGARSKENPKPQQPSNRTEPLKSSRVNEICRSFIRGYCKYGADKCWSVHFGLPYKWEVEVDEDWIDLPDNEVIEKDYCDPTKIHSVGGEPVFFDTMNQGEHRVRRLSTVSSAIESNFSHTTKWIWYWENEYHNWIQYGSVKEMHRLSSVTSEDLEKNYLRFLEDDGHDVVKFTAGKRFYELNFRTMSQRNEVSNTERSVRRRPEFVSVSDVRLARKRHKNVSMGEMSSTERSARRRPEYVSVADVQIARTRRGPNSSSHTGVPGFWDKSAIPESGFQRVLLDSSHKDYIRVQEHFHKTVKHFNILTIERIQNKKLWEDFQTKREQMKKANSHKKYGEAERLLFHGTNTKNIDAICQHNFYMRVSGANATVYGQGSYFARDAKYSNDYTDHCGERIMFACRVLVGQYTKGESRYHKAPVKDAAGNLYDSCVNDVRDPTVYVVFQRCQVYPEFLITYEKSKFPKDIDVMQSTVSSHGSDVSQTAGSEPSTSSSPKANSITSGSGSTGETLVAVSMPSGLESQLNPVKDLSSDSKNDDKIMMMDSLDVIPAAPDSELSVHSKPTQHLTSLSRLLKESDDGVRASVTNTDFSTLDNPRIAARSSLKDTSIPTGIGSYQLETSPLHSSNTETEITSRGSWQASQNSAPLRSPEFDKSATDTLDPFSCSSDMAKVFQVSSEMETKTSSRTGSTQKQSLDIFDENQRASEFSTRSLQEKYIITSSAGAGDESLTPESAKGSLSSTGLSRESAQDLLTLEKIPVSSHLNNQLLISAKPSVTDRSIHSTIRPDLVTKQKSPQKDSPAARTGVAANFSHPLLSTTARNLITSTTTAASHSANESKILATYTPSSSSPNKQCRSDGSSSSSSVSFYERQPSALSGIQTSSTRASPLQAPQQKKVLGAQSGLNKTCKMQ